MSSTSCDKSLFALVDCNNFYASCERVFQPHLVGKPVIILSNNDGCVIARSNEAKALGIPMGAPLFQYADLIKRNAVHMFSSNYTLYGEMSQRVMKTLAQWTPDLEIYSIDEAFLRLVDDPSLLSCAQQIKHTVYQWTGIPVSIGIAPTKTLAKVVNRYVKKKQITEGFFILNKEAMREKILKDFEVKDIWGIGHQISALLHRNNIRTGRELINKNDDWIQKNLSVVGLRTVWELRGISCLPLEEATPARKSIVCSKSFGADVYAEVELVEALSTYVASAAERLRNQKSLTSCLEVFLHTSRFKEGQSYHPSIHVTLPVPSDYTPQLTHYAKEGLHKIYKEGFAYKKVGVMLGGIVSNQGKQLDLFAEPKSNLPKQRILMQLMDKMNAKLGKGALKFPAQGIQQTWKMKRSLCTPHYTTSWKDLLQIKI
ncbi:Y-family DNA polymerase [Candidatus Protochlamydia sp. W-9]|uniref:Y-family DNA polymerase n=1 Tax=Candidatus Protochlamydia sp. W-9 TaxID=1785087 RepID=UPI00096A2650|nr:Y-family DNA polymerase [Candidatus Protochlamydia sp. W-9]